MDKLLLRREEQAVIIAAIRKIIARKEVPPENHPWMVRINSIALEINVPSFNDRVIGRRITDMKFCRRTLEGFRWIMFGQGEELDRKIIWNAKVGSVWAAEIDPGMRVSAQLILHDRQVRMEAMRQGSEARPKLQEVHIAIMRNEMNEEQRNQALASRGLTLKDLEEAERMLTK